MTISHLDFLNMIIRTAVPVGNRYHVISANETYLKVATTMGKPELVIINTYIINDAVLIACTVIHNGVATISTPEFVFSISSAH